MAISVKKFSPMESFDTETKIYWRSSY